MKFPLENRWLNGEEYAFLLRHYRAVCEQSGGAISVTDLSHPDSVYDQPKSKSHPLTFTDGQIYFIRGWHLREFGFPRADNKRKVFKWKKMNFTTDLPKQDPICTYLVATGKIDEECYRMHVVVNSKEYNAEYRNSQVLHRLKKEYVARGKHDRSKLLPEDRKANTERMILCHIMKVKDEKFKKI